MQTSSAPFVTRSGARPVQDGAELMSFLALVRKHRVRRYLEIGCKCGDTLFEVMSRIGPGGFAVALDLPWNPENEVALRNCVYELGVIGSPVKLLLGSSHDPALIEMVYAAAPFDLVLIDADHRYEAVKQDWENFGNLAPIVAIHDIAAPEGHISAGHPIGVPRFWNEIKGGFEHEEIIAPGSNMGFGILHMGGTCRAG